MKNTQLIRLKAAFLLMVFSLNMIVAFACAIGLDMNFNKSHHHEKNEEQVSTGHEHHHSESTSHQHKQEAGIASHHDHEEKTPEEGCCNDKAIKFQQVDKSLAHTADLLIKSPVFIAFLSAFYNLDIKPGKSVSVHKYLLYHYYPPPDIRIAIQSFQI